MRACSGALLLGGGLLDTLLVAVMMLTTVGVGDSSLYATPVCPPPPPSPSDRAAQFFYSCGTRLSGKFDVDFDVPSKNCHVFYFVPEMTIFTSMSKSTSNLPLNVVPLE